MKYEVVEQALYIQDGELWRYCRKEDRKVNCRDKYQLVSVNGVSHKYQKLLYMLHHKVSLRDSVKVGFKDGDNFNHTVSNLYVMRKKYTYK